MCVCMCVCGGRGGGGRWGKLIRIREEARDPIAKLQDMRKMVNGLPGLERVCVVYFGGRKGGGEAGETERHSTVERPMLSEN